MLQRFSTARQHRQCFYSALFLLCFKASGSITSSVVSGNRHKGEDVLLIFLAGTLAHLL